MNLRQLGWHIKQRLETLRDLCFPADGIALYPMAPGRWSLRAPGFRHTIRLRPHSTDFEVLAQVFLDRHYRLSITPYGREIIRFYHAMRGAGQTPLIIDCGANIGASALYFKALFDAARICAIEPEPGNFALLEENTSGLGIVAVNAAVHNKSAAIRVVGVPEKQWAFRTVEAASGEPSIPAVAISSLLAGAALADATPFLIKIDIEGFESALFAENFRWIDAFPMLIIELHDWMLPGTASSRAFFQALAASAPRDVLWRGENIFSVRSDVLQPRS